MAHSSAYFSQQSDIVGKKTEDVDSVTKYYKVPLSQTAVVAFGTRHGYNM